MQTRKRITMLSNTRGGVYSFTANLTQKLVCRGCTVKIFFLDKPAKKNLVNEIKNIKIDYLLTHTGLPNLYNLAKLLLENDVDVVHINFASFVPLALFKKLVFRTPFVLTLHGLPQPSLESVFKNKIRYSIEQLTIPLATKHAASTIVVSEFIKRTLHEKYGADSKVIYHGLDGAKIKSTLKAQAKKRFGYQEDDFVVLFVGNLNAYKDPLTLIRAFGQVVSAHKSYLILVGKGELTVRINMLVKELNLCNNVRLLKDVTEKELDLCYSVADLFVLPTVNEAFGIVLLEAMAHGVPILCSASGAAPEIVGNAGLLFKHGESTDLARQMLKLISDNALLERLRIAGFERVRTLFSIEEKADQYCEELSRVS